MSQVEGELQDSAQAKVFSCDLTKYLGGTENLERSKVFRHFLRAHYGTHYCSVTGLRRVLYRIKARLVPVKANRLGKGKLLNRPFGTFRSFRKAF